MTLMTRRILIVVAVVALAALTIYKLLANKEEMEHKAAAAAMVNEKNTVRIALAENDRVSKDFDVSGKFEPIRELRMTSETQGVIQQLLVKEGSRVAEGQLIGKVETDALQNQLDIARENLAKSQKDLARYEKLAEGGAIPSAQIDDLRLGIKNTESQIKGLEITMRKTSLKAPIGGVINELMVERGSNLMPGTPIADIVDVSRLEMLVSLTESELASVSQGQRLKVAADLYPESTWEGSVSFIGVKADGSGKFPVKVGVANNSGKPLRAGMTGTVRFTFAKDLEGIFLPRTCIIGSLQNAKVFVVNNDGILEEVAVKTGIETGGRVQILSGLSVNQRIVSGGQERLSAGMAVEILP
ncbi:MAG: efflux RND transporter periplasmic adaptor subunit [Bacteroidetes bacterium]|nr:MAG: efflux RND transporter periplasmic adaptor subunit [Bacteroidota bacterium]